MNYLDKINSPKDLKALNVTKLKVVAREIREFLVKSISRTGGHLASNLGVVELTIALHYCLNSPIDKILWDVGHQSYPHKILTGRRSHFDTLRQFNGLSGFIKSSESPHDAFDVGHSSTSLSVAHGMAASRDLQNQNHKIFAVIGDGSLTSGLALEGLNNIGRSGTNLVIILNDNQMSISENVGALSQYLNDLRSAPGYINVKQEVRDFLQGIPIAGKFTKSFIEKTKSQLKYLLLQGVLFEELGFNYYGPIDGHNLKQLIGVIQNVSNIQGPIVVHVRTEKGKGYKPAEKEPLKYHGAEPFYIKSGMPKIKYKSIGYTDIFAEKVVQLARTNPKIVAISASMPTGTGLENFKRHFPSRFFDVGIAESHAVTFAAGMAKSGMKPIVAIYSTFLQRAYDQILHDVCIQNLPVIFAIDRAGPVPGDGETHQGVFDISFLSHMPNMTILAPKNAEELKGMMDFAIDSNGPVAIRYPKDTPSILYAENSSPISAFKGEILEEGEQIAIFAVGAMLDICHAIWQKLIDEGYSPCLINPRFIKPIDVDILQSLKDFTHIFTIEDNAHKGGFGQMLQHTLKDLNITKPKLHSYAIPDKFLPAGKRSELFALLKLDSDSIYNSIKEILNNAAP